MSSVYYTLIEYLRWNTVKVNFEKTDGTIREMRCTLKKDLIPPPDKYPVNKKKVRELNDEVVVVWDLDKEAWRSFRVDRLNAMEKCEI